MAGDVKRMTFILAGRVHMRVEMNEHYLVSGVDGQCNLNFWITSDV